MNFGCPSVRLLIEGGSNSSRALLRYYYIISNSAGRARAVPASPPSVNEQTASKLINIIQQLQLWQTPGAYPGFEKGDWGCLSTVVVSIYRAEFLPT